MSATQLRQGCLEDAPRDTEVAPGRSSRDSRENGDGVTNPTKVNRSNSELRGELLALISGFRVIKGRIAASLFPKAGAGLSPWFVFQGASAHWVFQR